MRSLSRLKTQNAVRQSCSSQKKSVEIMITEGPIKGTKIVLLNPLDNHKTRIDVVWNIKLAGFLSVFTGMVKRHIAKGTDEALVRIAEAVE